MFSPEEDSPQIFKNMQASSRLQIHSCRLADMTLTATQLQSIFQPNQNPAVLRLRSRLSPPSSGYEKGRSPALSQPYGATCWRLVALHQRDRSAECPEPSRARARTSASCRAGDRGAFAEGSDDFKVKPGFWTFVDFFSLFFDFVSYVLLLLLLLLFF